MSMVDEVERMMATVAASGGGSVVGVAGGRRAGSGVVVGDGRILTNAHNLGRESTIVTMAGGRQVTAEVRGADADGDLAVLAADTTAMVPVAWGDGVSRVGSVVVALANPAGRGLKVTMGTISAVDQAFRGPGGRRILGSFEHTAPLPRGSSGGPVLDLQARLVGINTNRLGEGFYLALPADAALRARVDALAGGHWPAPRRLGVAVAPADVAIKLRRSVGLDERTGLLVREVEETGPAARADIRPGDLLVAAGGRPLGTVDDLHAALGDTTSSDSILFQVVRATDELEIRVSFPDE